MKTSIVINFNGDAQEAITMYKEAFNLNDVNVMTYGSLPKNPNFQISEDEENYVFQASISVGGLDIMIQDLLKPMQIDYNNNITLSVNTQDEANVRRWFEIMSEGGQVTCPMQEMPWSKLYGAVKDKFGTSWQFQIV